MMAKTRPVRQKGKPVSIVDLIIKKRQGQALARDEIESFVNGVTDGSWHDYQTSAMLMAMFIRGLDDRETADLTLAMARSGDQFDLSQVPGVKVDKHSTGGVADTVTLIAAPLVAACGVPVVKISGRGLGFTGGTIDKLESIPGFKVGLSTEEAIHLAVQNQLVIMSQTDRLTPADKKMYGLRDVTGTIDSIPLIAASIMSKKIAGGTDAFVLDVKCGNGSFMRDLPSARKLAEVMVQIGRLVNRKVMAVISSMDQPLGNYIGNALEVIEAIEVLKGRVQGDLLEVSLVLSGEMLLIAGRCDDMQSARALLLDKLVSGAGLEKLRRLIAGQGGDVRVIDHYDLLPQAACTDRLLAGRNGYIQSMNTAGIGCAFVETGGGRLAKEDSIDYAAGIILMRRLGEFVEKGQALAEIRAVTPERAEAARVILQDAFQIGPEPVAAQPVILDRIT
jgi:pyrimidine-nucleoside phosphorylase